MQQGNAPALQYMHMRDEMLFIDIYKPTLGIKPAVLAMHDPSTEGFPLDAGEHR